MFSSKYKYIHVYTVLTLSYTCLYIYIHCLDLKFVCSIGRQLPFKWQCLSLVQDPAPLLTLPDGASPPKWLEYIYQTAHPTLRWLPTKLAEWIGENMQEELGFPDKADKREEPGTGWTPAELNQILHYHVVAGELTTFGCVEWQSQLFRGVMCAGMSWPNGHGVGLEIV